MNHNKLFKTSDKEKTLKSSQGKRQVAYKETQIQTEKPKAVESQLQSTERKYQPRILNPEKIYFNNKDIHLLE